MSRGRWIWTTGLLSPYRFEACTQYLPGSSTHNVNQVIANYIYHHKPWHFYENVVRKIKIHFLFSSTIMVQNHNPQLKWGKLPPPSIAFLFRSKIWFPLPPRPLSKFGKHSSHKIIIISPPCPFLRKIIFNSTPQKCKSHLRVRPYYRVFKIRLWESDIFRWKKTDFFKWKKSDCFKWKKSDFFVNKILLL